jgi:hypothetical protein
LVPVLLPVAAVKLLVALEWVQVVPRWKLEEVV